MFKIQGFDGVNLQEFEQPNIKTRLENLSEQFVFFFANQSDFFYSSNSSLSQTS